MGRDIKKLKNLQSHLCSLYPNHYDIECVDFSNRDSLKRYKESLELNKCKFSGFVLITPRPLYLDQIF